MTPLQGISLLAGLGAAIEALARRRGESSDTAEVLQGDMRVRHREVETIEERLAALGEMVALGRADPVIRRLAVQAVSDRCGSRWCIPEGDERGEVAAVFAELRKRYRYVADTWGEDLFQHPVRTLEFGGGDCDDATALLGSTLGAIGYRMGARVVQTRGHDWWNHVYAIVALPKSRPTAAMPLDLSVAHAKPGWEVPRSQVVQRLDFFFS